MKKIAIVATLAAVAFVMGLGGLGRTTEVQAKPTGIVALNPLICASLMQGEDWDDDGDVDAADAALAAAACLPPGMGGTGLTVPAQLAALVDELDGDEPEDFAEIDLDGDQLMEDPALVAANTPALPLWILVWVDDDDSLTMDPRAHMKFVQDATDSAPADGDFQCDAAWGEADCDNNPATVGDGIVVGTLYNLDADPGDVEELEVVQEGTYETLDINVVGVPDEIEVIALEDTIQGGFDDCDDLDLSDASDEAEDVSVALVLATVSDSDGTALAGVGVDWDSDDTDVVDLTAPATISLVLDEGTFAVNLACGYDPGTAEVTGEISYPVGDIEDDTVTITVIGGADDVALTASPAEIICDGVNSADVTATVTDADGNPVVDGTEVRFDVVALGTAYPILVDTVDGMASSTITPLSGIGAGVTVIVSAGDAEASIRVDCTEPAPPPPPPPPPPPEPGIVPPPTGTGGYLAGDASGLSWLALAGLAIGGLTLSLGGIALRRYAR